MNNLRLGIIGMGNLGTSLSKLLISNGFDTNLKVADINMSKIMDPLNIGTNKEVINESDIIFLTVKPNNMKEVLFEIKNHAHNDTLIVSTAAGIDIEYIENKLDSYYPVIRCMPNLPIKYKSGSMIYMLNENVHSNNEIIFENLMKGPYLLKVTDEKLLDVGTVLSGCMPGFISLISKTYIGFGVRNGFTEEESLKLYSSSIEGTLKMLGYNTPEEVMVQVSSPGGATEEGLKILHNYDMDNIIKRSLFSSMHRINNIKKKMN